MDIGVVGAGTAGAAAALLLGRAGHRVTLFERVEQPLPVGAGITLQPTGQAVLARLGLLGPVMAKAARVDRLHAQTREGRTLVDLRYDDLDGGFFGLGVHRGVLFQTLLDAVRVEPGVTLRLGHEVLSRQSRGGRQGLSGPHGDLGDFDLVVVADGSVSELHASSHIRHALRPYPWGALWFVAEDPEDSAGTLIDQLVDGAAKLCGILPTGEPVGEHGRVASLFWSLRADRLEAWRAAGLDVWKNEVRSLHPRAAPLLDQIRDIDQVLFTQYRDVHMAQWHEEGTVFIGDAAHATSPQLGQGANLALWDAMVLADCIGPAAAEVEVSLNERLARYTRERKAHLNYYQFATRALTPIFQSDSVVLGWVRDVVFPWSVWLGPLRRRMVRTMAGLDRGVVRPPIPVATVRALLSGVDDHALVR